MNQSWPFAALLVANRGEVVMRVLRTAQALGLRTVVVFTDADAAMPYLRLADAAVRVESYLDGAAMVAAARTHGAAVHPGYGFLAESDAFAQQVIDAGLTWVGPTPASMRAVGNKSAAKRLLHDSTVPLLPGYEGTEQDDAALMAAAREIGMPLMVKASAGGGGRGMRLVHDTADLAGALARARSEAQQAFGCGDLLLERAVVAARHIEVQVFGDTAGVIVHMGERDCSVQRRHQKLIEESPSPAVDAALRARITGAALQVARACNYVGAGTVEFLLEAGGAFWFIEMNTRLQVEHTVTEALAALDLVEWQLRVAAGQSLPMTQQQIDARMAVGGHAIEVRLCAEDPARAFLPQSGRIALWRRGGTLRCEDALADGQEVSPLYDSMLAKLIAHDGTREQARLKLAAGLRATVLLGVASNQDYLCAAIDHPDFVNGAATTAFVDSAGVAASGTALDPVVAAALVLARRRMDARYPELASGWSNSLPLTLPLRIEVDGVLCALGAQMNGSACWRVVDGERNVSVRIEAGIHDLSVWLGETPVRASWAVQGDRLFVRCAGQNHVLIDRSYASAQVQPRELDGRMRAPMNGRIVAVHAEAGQTVQAGQAVLVIDAMKMEHCVAAPFGGLLCEMHVTPGQQVAPGLLMFEVAPTEKKA
ncbi:MAG: biotin carboxylase N-terminal domain-containing protein [Pseudomonadota bacterium]